MSYYGEIIISKNISVDGQGHTINAKNSACIFNITASIVILKDLIFKNGNATKCGAIFMDKESTLT